MYKKLRLILVLSMLFSIAGVFAQNHNDDGGREGNVVMVEDEDLVIKKGDTLLITVWRHEDLTQNVSVDDNGNITYPLLGEIKTAGLTIAGLKSYISYLLEKDYIVDPFVTVAVEKQQIERQFYVYGEVRQPGAYRLEQRLTVLKAITIAGGMTEYSSQIVYIKRKIGDREKRIRININNVIKNVEEDVSIQPDDIVVVTRRVF